MKALVIGLTSIVAIGLLALVSSSSDTSSSDSASSDSAKRPRAGNRTPLTADEEAAALRTMARKAAAEVAPIRPTQPPDPTRSVPPLGLTHPEPPPDSPRIKAEAWAQAVAANAPRPGEAAFRATAQAFMQHNERFARAQAQREGLTLEEVRELTYLGLLAAETQRWAEVAQLVGRDITEQEQHQARALLDDLNQEFKARMRQLVAEGVSADERWQLIRATEAGYLSSYFAITRMTPELLDVLLAGDASRAYAASTTTPVETAAPSDRDPAAPQQRPQAPPED